MEKQVFGGVGMEKFRFFNDGVDDPRSYNAEDFAEYFGRVLTNGILNGGTNLQVATAGTNMQSTIADGFAWVEGYLYKVEGGHAVTHPAADPALDRIDRVVVRLDRGIDKRHIKAFVVPGTPAVSPEPPSLTRAGEVFELSLARVLIKAGLSTIAPANVTDERHDAAVCGLVNSLVQVDTAQMQAELDAFMATTIGQGYAPMPDFLAHANNGQLHGAVTKTEFVASGTWNKPEGSKWVLVDIVSGGGGGAGGYSGSNSDQIGSHAGGGGGRFISLLSANSLPATVSVVVGAGGIGRAPGNNTPSSGGNSSFGGIVVLGADGFTGGGLGRGTGQAYGHIGARYLSNSNNGQPSEHGGGGGGYFFNHAPGVGGSSLFGGAGGGGGGNAYSPTPATGGVAGLGGAYQVGGGAAGGTTPGGHGQYGADATVSAGAGGGGGGGGTLSGAAGNGGHGGFPGGGGGGGGSSRNGTGGQGGNGGNGRVIVYAW